MSGEERTVARFEAVVLGVLATTPLLPYLRNLVARPVQRFVIDGDYAGLELATRYAFTGRTLLGPYSRFQFNHPGPMYFFCIAPIHRLFGETATGIFAGALVLNAIAAFTIAFALRLLATRAHAIAGCLTVLAWLAAFGNLTSLPWNPLVIVLPLFAFFVLAGSFAAGHSAAAPAATVFAALVTQTHLSTVPTVTAVSMGACVAFVVQRRRTLARRDRRALVAAAALCLLAVLPPLIEQVTSPEGNLTKLFHFFVDRKEPPKSLAESWDSWRIAACWLPQRLLERTVASEGGEAMPMGSGLPPVTATTLTIGLFFLSIAGAGVLAWKRRDRVSLALAGVGILASLSSLLALRAVVGPTYCYLLYWTTAATSTVWLAAISSVASFVPRHVGTACVLALAILATSNQTSWLAKNRIVAPNAETPREDVRTVYKALRDYMREHDATPVFHPDASWNTSLELMNELARDGLEGRVEERERWILGRQFRTPTGAPRIFHVYTSTWYQKLETAPCLELVKKDFETGLYVSPVEVTRCP